MIYLREQEVVELLPWHQLIPAMEQALAQLSNGKVIQPLRNWIAIEEDNRFWGIMPAAVEQAMGIKLVSFYPVNAEKSLPTIRALVLVVNAETGEPIGIVDANGLTAQRTAAVSAAVTKMLAPEDSKVLAILGSGAEAQSHLDALSSFMRFEEIRVWSRTLENAERFAKRNSAKSMGAESAVRGADVVVAATGTQTPILKGSWLKPGAHVNSIGAPMPTWRELDDEAMQNTIVVESREAVLEESGDVILSNATIAAEIGELFAGTKVIDRSQTTVYKSVGVAVEDVFAAKLALDNYQPTI